MKVEITRAEVERIILAYLNGLIPNQNFNTVDGGGYRDLPSSVTISTVKVEDHAEE
jgi:hypothetical protein